MSSSQTILHSPSIQNIIVPINGTGYGVAGTAIAETFVTARAFSPTPKRIICIGNPSFETKESEELIAPYLSKEPFEHASSLVFWHAGHLNSINVPNRNKSIAYTTFELETLSQKEIDNLDQFHTVATTTWYHTEILSKSCRRGINTLTIPHGRSNLGLYKPDVDFHKIWGTRLGTFFKPDTLFLSSIGKYEKRKGFYKLLDIAVCNKYTGPTVILASWHNPFFSFPFNELHTRGFKQIPAANGYTVYSLNNLKIVLLPPTKTRKELIERALLSHAFISVSHGEGWNLPLAEMFETRIPLISSIPHVLTYLSNGADMGFLIPQSEHVSCVAIDGVFFHGTSTWFDFSLNSVVEQIDKLRAVVMQNKNRIAQFRNELYTWHDAFSITWNSN